MNYWDFMRDGGKSEAERQQRLAIQRMKSHQEPQPPKIRVFDGSLVNPYKLTSTDMKPYVFIHAISALSRFHGHASYPYTVGQHSRNLCMLVPDCLKRAALLHDFSEALFNDLASPVKRENPEYRAAEHACGLKIANFFGVSRAELLDLDKYDKRIYANERDALFAGKVDELGMGDQSTPLPTNGLNLFGETHWRKVRADLTLLWLTYFPEFDLYTGDTINVEHR